MPIDNSRMPSASANEIKRPRIRLMSGSFWSLLTQISTYIVTIVMIVAARVLGADQFGHFSFALALSYILTPLTDFGTSTYAAIMMAREPSRLANLLDNAFGVRVVATVLYLGLCMSIAMAIIRRWDVTVLAAILALDNVVRQASMTVHAAFRAQGLFQLETRTNVIERIAIAILVFGVLPFWATFAAVGWAILAGRCCGLISATGMYSRRFCMPRPRFERGVWCELFRYGTPLGLRAFFAWLLWQSDVLILGTFRSAGEVGWYAAAYQLLRGVRIIPNVLCNPLGPAISQIYGVRGIEGALSLFRRTLKYLVVLAVPIAFYTTVISEPIINFLYGKQYAASTPALQILIWATLFIFAEQAAYTLFDNVDRRSFTVWVFGIALAVNVGLNFIFIPQYGYMAAAVSTIISEGIAFLMLYGFLLRERWKVGIGRVVWGSVSAGFLSATLLLFAHGHIALAIPLGILAFAIYVLILWAMRIWEREEMKVARKALTTARRWWCAGMSDEEV